MFRILNNSEFSLDHISNLLYRVLHTEKQFGISNAGFMPERIFVYLEGRADDRCEDKQCA